MQFENDLLELIKSVKFKKVKNKFLDQLHKDITSIKKSKNVFIFADKTWDIYETDKNTYSKLLTDNISKTYTKTEHIMYNKINKEAKIITNRECRLINPAKSEIGKISKYFLQQLNSKVRNLSSVNQWQETSTVINWFRNIKNKKKCIFMQFDIEEIYLSISKELLLKAITYAKTLVNISDEETP